MGGSDSAAAKCTTTRLGDVAFPPAARLHPGAGLGGVGDSWVGYPPAHAGRLAAGQLRRHEGWV